MGSLVLEELDKIDAEHLGLTKLHSDIISALELYNKLMTEVPTPSYHPHMMNYGYQYNPQYNINQGGVLPPQQQMMQGGMQYNYQPNNMYQQPPQAQMQMQYQQQPAMQQPQYQHVSAQQLNYQQQIPAQQMPSQQTPQQMNAQQMPNQQMNDQQMNNQQQQMHQIPAQQQQQGYNQANYYTNQTTTQANSNLSSWIDSQPNKF